MRIIPMYIDFAPDAKISDEELAYAIACRNEAQCDGKRNPREYPNWSTLTNDEKFNLVLQNVKKSRCRVEP